MSNRSFRLFFPLEQHRRAQLLEAEFGTGGKVEVYYNRHMIYVLTKWLTCRSCKDSGSVEVTCSTFLLVLKGNLCSQTLSSVRTIVVDRAHVVARKCNVPFVSHPRVKSRDAVILT